MPGFATCKNGRTRQTMAGAKQPVHSFLGGKGLGIQQRTSVWVGPPTSQTMLASYVENTIQGGFRT